MGWFSRKDSESESGRRTASRGQRAIDDDAHALRQRARHRLIGALALVLAAIIVVPMLVGTEPEAPTPVPQVVQAPIPPLPEPISPDTGAQPSASGQVGQAPPATSTLPEPAPVPEQPPAPVSPPAAPQPPQAADNDGQQRPAAPQPDTSKPAKPADTAKPATPEKPADKPASGDRTDDGAVALALLEGRSPQGNAKPAPAPAKGNFVLQIVALSSDSEAQNRRSQLVAAGVTNAFVESATSGGKTTYRLRVGPFPTREAAQAAQTRLRALGYDNSFISSK